MSESVNSPVANAENAFAPVLRKLPYVGPNADSMALREANLDAGALTPNAERTPNVFSDSFSTVLLNSITRPKAPELSMPSNQQSNRVIS